LEPKPCGLKVRRGRRRAFNENDRLARLNAGHARERPPAAENKLELSSNFQPVMSTAEGPVFVSSNQSFLYVEFELLAETDPRR